MAQWCLSGTYWGTGTFVYRNLGNYTKYGHRVVPFMLNNGEGGQEMLHA